MKDQTSSSENKNRRERRRKQAKVFAANAGSFVEHSIGSFIEQREEAPVLSGEPMLHVWYRIPVPEGLSGDGTAYHIYLRRGNTKRLCLFLSGGGAAWNEYTAARPVTGAAVAAGEPNYYWNNLRPFTQIMNINIGITENSPAHNPFWDWNMVVVPYTTGDFHVGRNDFPYTALDGSRQILHFHGRRNFEEAMKLCLSFFDTPTKLLVAGDSAGAFAVPALAGTIADDWYPDCGDITLFSDSALLINDQWQSIARDVWHADASVWEPLRSDNIVLDWYRALLASHPGRFRCLYASSTHDYLLSAFYNDMTNRVYRTDSAVQKCFRCQLRQLVPQLRALDPDFSFFFNNWKNPIYTKGQPGTIHTAVRLRYFYTRNKKGATMAGWLRDAVEGRRYDIGTELL
ncbi:pectin acetylesterase-family hydrolase [Lachnoclostridium sp. Marseille-P6806]|uniref:pectin acetylesterase-family hydrolase n=1 Tax=Lachnoclostridium sp. Marseille-P6806 TaxID=2364793 RepID=UPI00102FEE6C|nr:pectin acetylesterase-family hydrolase [Lachnoclostridium sp. Marseille-P6806]